MLSAPVVTDQQRGLGAELSDEAADVVGEQVDAVGLEALRLRREVVAARVGDDDSKPAAASGAICSRQPNQNSGKPCSRTTSGPSPAST